MRVPLAIEICSRKRIGLSGHGDLWYLSIGSINIIVGLASLTRFASKLVRVGYMILIVAFCFYFIIHMTQDISNFPSQQKATPEGKKTIQTTRIKQRQKRTKHENIGKEPITKN